MSDPNNLPWVEAYHTIAGTSWIAMCEGHAPDIGPCALLNAADAAIHELESEVERLNMENDSLDDERAELESQRKALKDEVKVLERALRASEDRVDELYAISARYSWRR